MVGTDPVHGHRKRTRGDRGHGVTALSGALRTPWQVLASRCVGHATHSSAADSALCRVAGHAFIQNIRRGHYALGVDETVSLRVMAAFDELALAV